MKYLQLVLYLIISVLCFLTIYIIQDIIIGYIFDYYRIGSYIQLIAFSLINIFINPIITYSIIKDVKFFKYEWK